MLEIGSKRGERGCRVKEARALSEEFGKQISRSGGSKPDAEIGSKRNLLLLQVYDNLTTEYCFSVIT